MASLESLREQFYSMYSAVIDLEEGTWTYTNGSTTAVFTTRQAWLDFVEKQVNEALDGLLLLRDVTSEIQALPGIKPLFLEEGTGGLSGD